MVFLVPRNNSPLILTFTHEFVAIYSDVKLEIILPKIDLSGVFVDKQEQQKQPKTKQPYHAPKIEDHGDLRAAIRGVGTQGHDVLNTCDPTGPVDRGC